MEYRDCLQNACVKLELEGDNKDAIIAELVGMLVAAGKIKDREAVYEAVMARERQMSTGMQFGVAIPHGKIDSEEELVAAIALKKDGVDFAALDGKPSRIFIMTISSVLRAGPHIEFLAEVSKVLTRPSVRKRLLKAETREDILEIMTSGED